MQLLKMLILRAEEILLELPAQLVALGCARPEGAAMNGRVNGAHGRVPPALASRIIRARLTGGGVQGKAVDHSVNERQS